MIKCTVPADLLAMFPYDLAVGFPDGTFTRFSDGQTRINVEAHDAYRLISTLRVRAPHVQDAAKAAGLWSAIASVEAAEKAANG
ncbi:hypothetical protein [Oleiharenicola lentus]|uniref:hypothetical protein n=1 Tax=Oleiharenicola lentus TaxID=2508720 RepID=UPI003F679DD8